MAKRKKKAKKKRAKKAAKRRSKHIPLNVLKKRLAKLARVVASRS